MVSCAKRNLKNCPAVIRECLRDRGANHTAKCLRDSFTSARPTIQNDITRGRPRSLPTIKNRIPYFELTMSNIKVRKFTWTRPVTAATGATRNTVNLNGVDVELTMNWHRKEVTTRRYGYMSWSQVTQHRGTAKITARDSTIRCTYLATSCGNVQCSMTMRNYRFAPKGYLGGLLQRELPGRFRAEMQKEAIKLMKTALSNKIPTMTC